VGFRARFRHGGDAGLDHPPVRGVEVIDAEEESDHAGCLVTDGGTLVFPRRLGRAGLRTRWGSPGA
jgi:hypothetical protein